MALCKYLSVFMFKWNSKYMFWVTGILKERSQQNCTILEKPSPYKVLFKVVSLVMWGLVHSHQITVFDNIIRQSEICLYQITSFPSQYQRIFTLSLEKFTKSLPCICHHLQGVMNQSWNVILFKLRSLQHVFYQSSTKVHFYTCLSSQLLHAMNR
jgi:hypothetical protein